MGAGTQCGAGGSVPGEEGVEGGKEEGGPRKAGVGVRNERSLGVASPAQPGELPSEGPSSPPST